MRVIPMAIQWLFSHWMVSLAIAAMALACTLACAGLQRRQHRRRSLRLQNMRLTLAELDTILPVAFEWAIHDLMVRDGINARHVGGRGDKAADVIGRAPSGHLIVVQCKHTTVASKVGTKVIYVVNGTARPVHGADAAAVVTNGTFTRDAKDNAAQLGIHLIDRHQLERWAAHGMSLTQILHLKRPLRRRRGTSQLNEPPARS